MFSEPQREIVGLSWILGFLSTSASRLRCVCVGVFWKRRKGSGSRGENFEWW